MTKQIRPPDWRSEGRKERRGFEIGTPSLPQSPTKLQDVPWRDIESVIVSVGGVSCGDTVFAEDAQFFADHPDETVRWRIVCHKEWPLILDPKTRARMQNVVIERRPEGLHYAYFRHRGWGKRPWRTVLIPLAWLVDRAREMMGRA